MTKLIIGKRKRKLRKREEEWLNGGNRRKELKDIEIMKNIEFYLKHENIRINGIFRYFTQINEPPSVIYLKTRLIMLILGQ